MVQEVFETRRTSLLLERLAATTLRVLGGFVVALVLIARGGTAALGLRLSEESPLLSAWSRIGADSENLLRAAILVASFPAVLFVLGPLRGRGRVTASIVVLSAGVLTGMAVLAGRQVIAPEVLWFASLWTYPALGALVAALAPKVSVAILGSSLLLVWQCLATLGEAAPQWIERAGEPLLLLGISLAGFRSLFRDGLRAKRLLVLTGLAAGIAALSFGFESATRHLTAHFFMLDRAGNSWALLAPLFSLALATLVVQATGPEADRALALGLFLLLAGARGAEPIAFTLLALGLSVLVRAAWLDRRFKGGSRDPRPDQESFEDRESA